MYYVSYSIMRAHDFSGTVNWCIVKETFTTKTWAWFLTYLKKMCVAFTSINDISL